MIRIIAKGPVKSVKLQAREHGVTDLVIRKRLDCNQVLAFCPDTANNNDKVSLWFVDPALGYQAPFLPGSCLWYTWD